MSVETAEKQRQVLELRREHPEATIAQLAAMFGFSKTHTARLLNRAIAAIPMPLAEEARKEELFKLDRDEAILEKKIVKGDTRAIRVRLRIAERRARLLGLDAPRKIQQAVVTTTVTPTDWDLSKLNPAQLEQLRNLVLLAGAPVPPVPALPAHEEDPPDPIPLLEPQTLQETSQELEDLNFDPAEPPGSDFATTIVTEKEDPHDG